VDSLVMPRVHLYIKAAQIGPTAPQTGEATEALPRFDNFQPKL